MSATPEIVELFTFLTQIPSEWTIIPTLFQPLAKLHPRCSRRFQSVGSALISDASVVIDLVSIKFLRPIQTRPIEQVSSVSRSNFQKSNEISNERKAETETPENENSIGTLWFPVTVLVIAVIITVICSTGESEFVEIEPWSCFQEF
jgi:hypothetical protein